MSTTGVKHNRSSVRPARQFAAYSQAESTASIAQRVGIDPVNVLRFDNNTLASPPPSARPAVVARALADINEYAHGGFVELVSAIAEYHGVRPEHVVLGVGSDDLIMLCARAFLRPGDIAAILPERTYAIYRRAIEMSGAQVGTDVPRLTFVCRPNNPTGEMVELPAARPLIVDEAYGEYAGESAVDVTDEELVVLRTFSKAFALAGARVGYAITSEATAAELNRWQNPYQISSLSAVLALAALRNPPDVVAQIVERDRLATALVALGLPPLPSKTNFLFVPTPRACAIADSLLLRGIVVRRYDDGLRINIRDRFDDDFLLQCLAEILERPIRDTRRMGRPVQRYRRVSAETAMRIRMTLYGQGIVEVNTGAGLYDHLLQQLAFHGGMDLLLEGVGDTETGDHHTAEDAIRTLGEAINTTLGDRRGLERYGSADIAMDEARARVALDLSGRPLSQLSFSCDPGLARHLLESFAQTARMTLNVDAAGTDPHHVAEAAFKATGRALRAAVQRTGTEIASTKGLL
jgi:histidinol-phosphate/aromatic aminotransferase/cobyric acid decarboxylase-like protein/imidazoleglycerol phosphate dehydratase HisB